MLASTGNGKLESAVQVPPQTAEAGELGRPSLSQVFQNRSDHLVELVRCLGVADACLPCELLHKIGIPHFSVRC